MIFLLIDNYLDDIEYEFDTVITSKIYLVVYFSSMAAMIHLGKLEDFYLNLFISIILIIIFVRDRVDYRKKAIFITMFSLISIAFNFLQISLYDIYGIKHMIFISNRLLLFGGVIFLNIFIQVSIKILMPYFNFLRYNISFSKAYILIVLASILIIFGFYIIYPFINSGLIKIIEMLVLVELVNTLYIMNYLIIIFHVSYNMKIINDTEIRVHYYNYSLTQFRDNIRALRKIRHDMRNHIIVLYSLVKNQKYDEFFSYVEQLNSNHALALSTILITNIPAMDIIIDNKIREAKNLGIKVELKIHIPYDIRVDEFDLVTIIGNVLDNAIHAASKLEVYDKYILFSIKLINDNVIIIDVHNTYENKNKGGKIRFGLGLENVRETVNKYNGFMHISNEDKLFKLRVIIYNGI